jgi:hypothetical protein
VYDPKQRERGLGLLGDADHLWTKKKRERQGHQVRPGKEEGQLSMLQEWIKAEG